jgi:two-component SAPR family response regulator
MNFIIIDDDEVNNMLCQIIIKHATGNSNVETFIYPKEGLNYIKNTYAQAQEKMDTILFLDINMPEMDGWEFLERYDELAEDIKSQLRIIIISSSVNEEDKRRATENKYVVNYIVKPLRKEVIGIGVEIGRDAGLAGAGVSSTIAVGGGIVSGRLAVAMNMIFERSRVAGVQ